MILKSLIITLVFVTLLSCASIGDKEHSETFVRSGISICGGGLESGVVATIEAEYRKQRGNLDAGFKQYVRTVLDANDVSEVKYKNYINCVLTIDKREREDENKQSCLSACDRPRIQCLSDKNENYNRCIRKGQAGCYKQCALRFGLSKEQCDEACDINKSHNIGTWERNYKCRKSNGSSCERSYRACKTTCLNGNTQTRGINTTNTSTKSETRWYWDPVTQTGSDKEGNPQTRGTNTNNSTTKHETTWD